MTFEQLFCKLGIPTYIQTLTVDISAESEIKIAETVPVQMGWIYGMNTYVDGVDPSGVTLITSGDAEKLYLKIVQGDTNFVNPIRIDDLIFPPLLQNGRYLELNVPGTISIDQSLILNPTNVASGRLLLVLRYVRVTDLIKLTAGGFFRNAGFVRAAETVDGTQA